MSTYKHINTDLLNEVADGSVELIQDLAEMFFKQAPVFSQQLDELYKNKDFTALGKLAHKIKGSVSTLGMDKLAKHMKDLENLSKQGIEQEKYPEMIENYKTISSEAIIELNDLLKRL
jgi:HPt (histidine-containing phosphotransfer) domain-containing protein